MKPLTHYLLIPNAPISTAQSDEKDDETKPDVLVVGDMEFSEKQYQFLFSNDTLKRHGLKRQFNHWTKGVVPVKFDTEFDADYKKVIQGAMDYIMSVSCIKFVVDFDEDDYRDYVKITKALGCSSPVGCQRLRFFLGVVQRTCEETNSFFQARRSVFEATTECL